jgi:predicted dehydrogenase
MKRRDFLKSGPVTGAGLLLLGTRSLAAEGPPGEKKQAPSDKLNMAIVGVGGRGAGNMGGASGENIVALCDVNDNHIAEARKKHPNAKTYSDWRRMFDDAKDFDAVVCSTTDHTHALVNVAAMKLGKHVYCEKPLAHSVHEARVVRETYLKNKGKIATQQGTQIHAENNYRRAVEMIQWGAIGPVREAHVWCNRPGPCPKRPTEEKPVPEWLNWDLWLGPAPQRPYHPAYHSGGCMGWEQWWDYGNGCMGDMGSHLIDLAFWALDLKHPATVEAEGEPKSDDAYPNWLIGHWEHPATKDRPAVALHWYDGVKRPPSPEGHDLNKWGIGHLFVGDKGKLITDYGRLVLLPDYRSQEFLPARTRMAPSAGHYKEWLLGCKTGSPTLCNFDYAGLLIENNLLATVAFRVGKKLEWDAENLKAKNAPEADPFIRRKYREGWTI